jgi:processive 1,2-diacylglycerol beta-glucosyltransferase
MKNPRILILHASVGSGHGRAAQALELAIGEKCPEASVTSLDVLDLANPLFRRVYSGGYFDAVAKAPHLVGYLYDRLDRSPNRFDRPVENFRGCVQSLIMHRLTDLLTSGKWDLVISTHFLPPEIVAKLRRSGKLSCPQVVVTTDFDTHRLWRHDPCEQYFTATEEGRRNLAAHGVDVDRITTSGIPIHPAFTRSVSPWACKRAMGLMDDRPVVLQLAGGLGLGPIEILHRQILGISMPIQLVTVTGRNTGARAAVEKIDRPSRHYRQVLGFTNQMDQLMAAADVIVSKPGGLTTSEALARGAAMVIVDPIPGQETRNSDYLLENGAAIKVNNPASLAHKLTSLLSDRQRLSAMRTAARNISRPHAAAEIARHCLELLNFAQPHAVAPPRSRRFWRSQSAARVH